MNHTRKIDRLTLLNAAVLTDYGDFRFKLLSIQQAKALVNKFKTAPFSIRPAIGHEATAELLTSLFDCPVAFNRKFEFHQTVDDLALVFRLRHRPPEGKVLTVEEMETIGYDFGLLTRLA